jgi:hypothetical protein
LRDRPDGRRPEDPRRGEDVHPSGKPRARCRQRAERIAQVAPETEHQLHRVIVRGVTPNYRRNSLRRTGTSLRHRRWAGASSRRIAVVAAAILLAVLAAAPGAAAADGVTIAGGIAGRLELSDAGVFHERVAIPEGVLVRLATARRAPVIIGRGRSLPGAAASDRYAPDVVDHAARRHGQPGRIRCLPASSRLHLWGEPTAVAASCSRSIRARAIFAAS